MPVKQTDRDIQVADALRQLEVQMADFGFRFIQDASVREQYLRKAQEYSHEIRESYRAGKITYLQAETMANEMRNELLDWARAKSSDIGRAKAVQLKAKGLALEDLVGKYSQQKFGKPPNALTAAERETVALEIVAAAGRPNPKVSVRAARLGAAGRALWVLAAVVAIYNIGTAENKLVAAGRETANLGGGMLGSVAAGAAAGIWFGPVGIAVGAAVGGMLGAMMADEVYVETAVPIDATIAAIIPRYTHLLWRDEDGLANAMFEECGINMDAVLKIVRHLNEYYSTDADDVVGIYVQIVRRQGGSVLHALKQHRELVGLLIATLDAGWTTAEEYRLIDYLKSL
ncbi:MAG: hypothetical protein GC160_04545 [Acidobacteria bacterium]|nr:hypothetical protein [Acidobacteriota bacterium]